MPKPDKLEREADALRRLWSAFGRHHAKRQAEREAAPPATHAALLERSIAESRDNCDPFLALFLSAAVPLWIERMRHWCPSAIECRAHHLTEIVAFDQGIAAIADPEARGTAKQGEKARCFNAIAEGLACLAYCPGGIVFGGHHWEVGR